jgi:hypothetical protein
MDPMPKQTTEGELVLLSGSFCGPRVERLSILFIPAFDDVDETKNLVINVKCRFTEPMGGGQRFNGELRAPRGIFHVTVLPILEGEGHLVTIEVHRIEVISACAGRVKQICSRIFPEHNINMVAPMTEALSYERFKQLTPQAFSILRATFDDILLTEKGCIEVVQRISSVSAANNQVWKVMLELSAELLQLHWTCYLAVQPFGQQRLLNFLPTRIYNVGFKLFCDCLCSYGQTGTLNTFLDNALSILEKFRTIAPVFEQNWNYMTSQLEMVQIYCLTIK